MEINSASFVVSNTSVENCPKTSLPEFAFIGRSNVGKSSLINMLLNQKNLAKTSSTPGKTLLINHFLVIEDQNILAVYSHMIEIPLYLPAYPLGHLIHFQLNEHFEGKDMGAEIQRIYALGRLSPQYWMQKAVGSKLSAEPLLKATSLALEQVMQ
jgi:hypothetical protein